MCITFVYFGELSSPLRLVLAMNRDELWSRLTEKASWQNGILAGRDRTPGKEGGTWLGVDRAGRIAFLTNVFTGTLETEARGRGFIVNNFLSGDSEASDYLRTLANSVDVYNPFNVCLIEPDKTGTFHGHCYCRGKTGHVVASEGPFLIKDEFFGLSNHPPSKPFAKTTVGLTRFADAVNKFDNSKGIDSLINDLFEVLGSEELCFPDEQMMAQAGGRIDAEKIKQKSCTFIRNEVHGTRMQTVIVVTQDGGLRFLERTVGAEEPDVDISFVPRT